jgi:hypothetical protein
MNVHRIRSRLLKIERRILPADDGSFTLEEWCRAMWREDKRNFLVIAKDSSFSLFVRQFEFDALESAAAARQMRRRE